MSVSRCHASGSRGLEVLRRKERVGGEPANWPSSLRKPKQKFACPRIVRGVFFVFFLRVVENDETLDEAEETKRTRQRSRRSAAPARRRRRNTRLACTVSVFPRIHLAGDFAANNDRFCQSFRPSSWSRFQVLPRTYLLTGARYCYLDRYRRIILNKRPRRAAFAFVGGAANTRKRGEKGQRDKKRVTHALWNIRARANYERKEASFSVSTLMILFSLSEVPRISYNNKILSRVKTFRAWTLRGRIFVRPSLVCLFIFSFSRGREKEERRGTIIFAADPLNIVRLRT